MTRDSANAEVLLLVPPGELQRQMLAMVEMCGAVARLEVASESDPCAISALPRKPAFGLIALGRTPTVGIPQLATLRTLKQSGYRVIVCDEGAEQWSIRERCLPLIAGAERILDSALPGFLGELKQALVDWITQWNAREREECQLSEVMAQMEFVGTSPESRAVMRAVIRVSRLSDLPTLLIGETGTGKERLARAIHRLDPRRSPGPFVPVNCGALSPALAESELFGHRRGAFTGAERDRKGLFRAAHRGVLFLDEIGELPETLQTKLLRVLQEGRVLTVGGEIEESVDVRVVAATHRDLKALTSAGKFRADLLHRISVLVIEVPPLRERREDIRPLIDFLLHKFSGANALPPLQPEEEFIEAMRQLELPGNVRQLENIVRRALVNHTSGQALRLADLPHETWEELASARLAASTAEAIRPAPDPTSSQLSITVRPFLERMLDLNESSLPKALSFCEKVIVSVALERAHGNQAEAARRLGITPRSVYNKIHKHRLPTNPELRP